MTSSVKVVVAGGGSGIGEATAELFCQAGAEVVITGRNADKLAAVAARIGASYEVADGRDAEANRQMFERIGAFDHLILCMSGAKGGGPFQALDLNELRSGFEEKLFAYLTTLQAALPYVLASVTMVSAASARAAIATTSGLAAINGALESMIAPLAVELAPIRVNAVSPGIIDTPWWNNAPKEMRDNIFAQLATSLPVGRVGQPRDVASAIFMIAQNGFMTGTVTEVTGGATLAK